MLQHHDSTASRADCSSKLRYAKRQSIRFLTSQVRVHVALKVGILLYNASHCLHFICLLYCSCCPSFDTSSPPQLRLGHQVDKQRLSMSFSDTMLLYNEVFHIFESFGLVSHLNARFKGAMLLQ